MELGQGIPYCNHVWESETLGEPKHSCYLDDGHKGEHVCGMCEEWGSSHIMPNLDEIIDAAQLMNTDEII